MGFLPLRKCWLGALMVDVSCTLRILFTSRNNRITGQWQCSAVGCISTLQRVKMREEGRIRNWTNDESQNKFSFRLFPPPQAALKASTTFSLNLSNPADKFNIKQQSSRRRDSFFLLLFLFPRGYSRQRMLRRWLVGRKAVAKSFENYIIQLLLRGAPFLLLSFPLLWCLFLLRHGKSLKMNDCYNLAYIRTCRLMVSWKRAKL